MRKKNFTAFLLLILAAAVFHAPGGSFAQDKPFVQEVWPLFYGHRQDGTPAGFCQPMLIRLAQSDAGDVRVGFFESQFFGQHNQWRAAGWMAAVVSSLTRGLPLSNWRISYDMAGNIDGPSAGGLMTNGLLAAMNGKKILPKITMTGTINPDGSIGPVGGIYYKLIGAKNAGKETVLIPAGQRMEKQKNGQRVDLVEHGRRLGITVLEVADVRDAYRHLTGQALPAPVDKGEKFEPPKKALAAMAESYQRWDKKFQEAIKRMKDEAGKVPARFRIPLAGLWNSAYQNRNKAQAAMKAGYAAAATQFMFSAGTTADTGAQLSYLFSAQGRGGLAEMRRTFQHFAIDEAFLNGFLKKLTSRPVKNVSDLITLSEACAYYNAAVGIHQNSQKIIKSNMTLGGDDNAMQALVMAMILEATAKNFSHFVDDLLHLGMGYPAPGVPDGKKLKAWAEAMLQAAAANLGYIDKTIIEPVAAEVKKTPEFVKMRVLGNDYQYLLANTTFRGVPKLLEEMAADEFRAAAILGGAVTSFTMSSLVVAKYYSLGAKSDKAGQVVKLNAPKGLESMLASARRRLRLAMLEAKAKGMQPIIPLLHLRSAEALERPGATLNDKFLALGEYWAGYTFCRLATVLAAD